MPLRGPNYSKTLMLVHRESGRVVRTNVGEDLLVSFPSRDLKSGAKEVGGDALSAEAKVDISPQNPHVAERVRVSGERLHTLEADHAVVVHPNSYAKNGSLWEPHDVGPLGFRGTYLQGRLTKRSAASGAPFSVHSVSKKKCLSPFYPSANLRVLCASAVIFSFPEKEKKPRRPEATRLL